MQRRITIGRFLLLALVIGALAVPATPAAAQTASDSGEFWSLSTHSVPVKRGGQTYQLSLHASEHQGEEYLTISLGQRRDPKGVTVASRTVAYTFELSGDRFTQAGNLSKAKVGSAKTMGSYGSVALEFAKNAATKSSCKGHTKSRTGRLKGSLTLKTGTKLFGTIKNVPTKGTLYYSDGKCGHTETAPCPPGGSNVSAYSYEENTAVSAGFNKVNGAKSVNVFAYRSEPGKIKSAFIASYLDAKVPSTKVSIAKDLGSATVKGVKGTWLTGTGEFTAVGDPFDTPATDCGRNKKYVTTLRPGEWQGNLAIDFLLGDDPAFKGLSGNASKSTVK